MEEMGEEEGGARDASLLIRHGYLEPDTLCLATCANGLSDMKPLKSKLAQFEAGKLCVEQNSAISLDGTEVHFSMGQRWDE